MPIRRLCTAFLAFILASSAFAWNEGITVSTPLITKDPDNLHGGSFSVWYNPENLTWRQFNLYFDLLGAHYWINGPRTPYHDINILAISPIIRYLFKPHYSVRPYFEFSVGLSYLSNTRFANTNQGMHFAFQDRGGLGVLMGAKEQLSLGLHAVHYSNASLASHNSGITIPLMIDISYKFL
ncbi:MAG TPA: acyloxyacyl hydrolase [Gammaproteobacteria bacterium]|nr:acyloxyacyl hydrolase [Gammaproteobacteria bacterium]